MDYKGYSISQVEAVLLFDILETQKEILQELRKLNESNEEVINEIEETEPIVETHETITEDKQELPIISKETKKKPTKKPTKKKTVKKKSTKV